MNKNCLLLVLLILSTILHAQQTTLTPDQIKALTPEWKGERSADGRPHVSDKLLQRLKAVHLKKPGAFYATKGT
jgi:hypothetical protein